MINTVMAQYDKYGDDASPVKVEERLTPLLVEGCGTRAFQGRIHKGIFLR